MCTEVTVKGHCGSKSKTQKNASETILVFHPVLSFLSNKILSDKAASKWVSNDQISLITLFVLCVLRVTLTQWFSAGAAIAPPPATGQTARSGDIFSCSILGVGTIASSAWRPGMLLHILPCTGQHPAPQTMVQPQLSVVPRQRILLDLQRMNFTHLSYSFHTKFENLPDFGSVSSFTLSR